MTLLILIPKKHSENSCYFAKYFNLSAGQVQPQLETFVDSTVKEFLDLGEKVPKDCVQWICNENLQWKKRMRDGLEVWSYFAERGSVVELLSSSSRWVRLYLHEDCR